MTQSKYFIPVLIIFFTLANCTLVPHEPPIINRVTRTYKISLDDTPQQRWTQILQDYKLPLQKFMDAFDQLRIPDKFLEGVEFFAKNVYPHKDFVAEVQTVAKLSGFPFDKLFFLNFMYEYSTACTAVLVCNSEGKVLHGRNLDFPMWGHLANLLVRGEYYKGGKKLFTSDFIVGSVIALTGSKPGAFSINVDTRTAKNFDQDLISVLKDGAIPTCWLVQRVLIEESTYARAVQRLKSTRIGGPVYYIVSGINSYEGIVIERQVNSVHASYELSEDRWFLVQTNYDRDQQDPKIDERRIPAEKRVEQKGNKMTEQELLDQVMVMWPNLNIETIMSTIMVASTGYHNTTTWYGANPTTMIHRED